jgi:hypothetical protein
MMAVACAGLCAGCAIPIARLPDLSPDAVEAEHRRQQIAQMRLYYAQLARVDTVAFRIRVANREFCQNVGAQIGMHAVTVQSLPRKYRSYSNEALGVSWTKPTVISVVEGSPAAFAGIKVGDQIMMLDEDPVPPTGTAGFIAGYLRSRGEQPVRVSLRRDGVDQTVPVTPVLACAIPIEYITDDTTNAFTNGEKIFIYSGIVALTRTDAQLAVIIGHELAHVTMGHLDKQRINMVIGMAGGAMIDGGFALGGIYTDGTFTRHLGQAGLMAYSVGFEREADYVGAYYAARAGYDLAGTEEVWRAMGQMHPDSIRFAKTHPATPTRFIQMREAATEIADKKRRHLPLVPDLKPSAQLPDRPAGREYNY